MIFRSTRWKGYRRFLRDHLAAIVATIIVAGVIGYFGWLFIHKLFHQPLPKTNTEKLNTTPTPIEKYTQEPGELYE